MLIGLYIFIVGLFFGSFYNVIANRIPNKESIIKPRSHCDNCGYVLTWYELIPIFSYLFLGGKCHKCKTKLSLEYPLVELVTGFLFLLSYLKYSLTYSFIISIIISSTVLISLITSYKYKTILNKLVIGAIPLTYLFIILNNNLITSLITGLIIVVIILIYELIKNKKVNYSNILLSFLLGSVLNYKLLIIYLIISTILLLINNKKIILSTVISFCFILVYFLPIE